jgi:spore coat protein U-like protein
MKVAVTRTALAFALIAVATLTAGSAFAQSNSASTSASASARIVAAIGISKTSDLKFGDVVASASLGTVVMTSAGARSATGGTTLGNTNGAAAAAFSVTGASGATYAISLPGSAMTIINGVQTMTVDTWTGSKATGTLTSGSDTFTVGGTLHVAANQVAGNYTANFNVTVNYN